MKADKVRKLLHAAGLTLHGAPRRFKRGMTGSWLWLVEIKEHREWGEVVFKYNRKPKFIQRELEHHGWMKVSLGEMVVKCHRGASHFVILEFIDNGRRQGLPTLSEVLHAEGQDRRRIMRALQTIQKHIRLLWVKSRTEFSDGQQTLYQEIMNDEEEGQYPHGRTAAYLEKRFLNRKELLRLPIRANGEDLPLSLQDAAMWIHTILSEPQSVRWGTHGDLKADNILVPDDGPVRLIDPRAGMNDWANDLAILSRTRNLVTVQQFSAERLRVEGEHLILNATTQFAPMCEVVAENCFTFGSEFADEFKDRSWEVRYWTHVGAAYFNEMQFYHERKEWGVVPRYAHPEAFLFAEAVRAILRAKNAAKHIE